MKIVLNSTQFTNLPFTFFNSGRCVQIKLSFFLAVIIQNFALKAEKASSHCFCIFLINFVFISQFQTLPPQGNPREMFLRRRIPWHKESAKARPLRQKNRARTPVPGQLFSKIQQKTQNTRQEKNSTETPKCLEILRVKHETAQSFLMGWFYGYSKYLKSFSIHP